MDPPAMQCSEVRSTSDEPDNVPKTHPQEDLTVTPEKVPEIVTPENARHHQARTTLAGATAAGT